MTRGIRNNNPGNIRHDSSKWRGEIQGTDKAFKTFSLMEWGVRAMFHLLNNYKKLHQCDTLRKLINRWAPPTENQTDRYVAFVAHDAKISPDQMIDTTNPDVMIAVVRSMIKMENGVYIDEQDLKKGWELFLKYK